ncbi:MAG: 4'-phosphopantetheinyl transferase superfamily protein [Bacteroidota bacterium]
MPFSQEFLPSPGIRAGIWHITESAGELLSLVNLTDAETTRYHSFRNDLRKRQWLAYHSLLSHMLDPASPDISYDQHGKPFLVTGSHYISVSHAGNYAAAIFAEKCPVGIDIEKLQIRVERVKERFMHPAELASISAENRLEQLYVYWCGKEALYKLHGKPEVDFRNDIFIHPFDYLCNTKRICSATVNIEGCRKDYVLHFENLGDYMLVTAS